MKTLSLVIVVCFWMAAGCGDLRRSADFVVTDSAGVLFVSNSGDGRWGEKAPTFVEELRIGSVDGPDYSLFGSIGPLHWDSMDNLYVLDGTSGQIRVFDPNGRFLRAFGGHGPGPEEFRIPSDLAVVRDTVLVRDLGDERLVRFSTDGRYLSEEPARLSLGSRNPSSWRVSPAGEIIEHLRLGEFVDGSIVESDFLLRRRASSPGSADIASLAAL